VRDLNAKVRAFIDGWNDRAHPFVWTKTAEQVLAKAIPKETSNARH
ncbi:MAG: IS630 family transposase, partial [Nocardioides sp.]